PDLLCPARTYPAHKCAFVFSVAHTEARSKGAQFPSPGAYLTGWTLSGVTGWTHFPAHSTTPPKRLTGYLYFTGKNRYTTLVITINRVTMLFALYLHWSGRAETRHWYAYFLHRPRGELLAALLLLDDEPRINIINVPWRLRTQSAG